MKGSQVCRTDMSRRKYGSLHEWCSQANNRNPHAACREMGPRRGENDGRWEDGEVSCTFGGLQGSYGCVVVGKIIGDRRSEDGAVCLEKVGRLEKHGRHSLGGCFVSRGGLRQNKTV